MKDTIWIKKGRFTPLAILLMLALPLTTSVICLCFGRMNVPVGEVLAALRTALTGGSAANVPDALKVTVRFDANGHGTAPAVQQVVLGTQLVLPDMADADGHAFAGWQQGGLTYKAGEVCGIMADTVFTAQWNSGTQGGGAGNTPAPSPAPAQKPNPQTGL